MTWIVAMVAFVLFGMFLGALLEGAKSSLDSKLWYHRVGGAIIYSLVTGSIFSLGTYFVSAFFENSLTFAESWLWTVGILGSMTLFSIIGGPLNRRDVDPFIHDVNVPLGYVPREIDEDLVLELEAESEERKAKMVSKRDAGGS